MGGGVYYFWGKTVGSLVVALVFFSAPKDLEDIMKTNVSGTFKSPYISTI